MSRGFGTTHGSGSTDSIETTLTAHATQRTYSINLYQGGAGGGSLGRIFEKRTAGAESERVVESGTTWVYGRTFSTLEGNWKITAPANNVWCNFIITYDSSSTSNDPVMYLDGVSQTVTENTAPSGTLVNNSDAYTLGNRKSDPVRNWNGREAEFAVWNRILTAGEIAAIGKGYSPLHFPLSLVCHEQMLRDNVNRIIAPSTIVGTAVQPHPRIILPRGSIFVPKAAAAAVLAGVATVVFSPVAALAGSGALAGALALAFAGTGAVSGAAALAGSSAVTFTPSAALAGAADLVGSANAEFTITGTAAGAGVLAGESLVTFAGSAIPGGAGALAGSSAVAFTDTATLAGVGDLAGASAAAFTGSAALAGAGDLAGASFVTFAPVGTLELPSGSMVGTSAVSFSGTASLLGDGALTGSSVVAFTDTATVSGAGDLAGSIGVLFSGTGALTGAATGVLSGLASLSFTPQGVMLADGALAGESVMALLAVAALGGSLSGDPEWRYSVTADDLRYSVAADDLRYLIAADDLRYRVLPYEGS